MADAAEAAASRSDLSLEHGPCRLAEQQVRVADDTCADQGLAISAARAHRRNAIGELDLADRPKAVRPRSAVHGAAINVDGGNDVVATCDVGRHLLDQVALPAAIPEMMMRI